MTRRDVEKNRTVPAIGAAGLTVIDTVAAAEVPVALVAVYWKVSDPE